MNFKIQSSEINRMMKIITQCIDIHDNSNRSNIEIGSINNSLYIHASNGSVIATLTTPMLGLELDKFCVDGQMFAKVCSMCSGEIEIATDGKVCTIKGTGRTRIPIVDATIPRHVDMSATKKVIVPAEELIRCYGHVAHAVSGDNSRIVLTGILTESNDGKLTVTTLDGFQLSIETSVCSGDNLRMIVPANFMKLITQASAVGEKIEFISDGSKLIAQTDSMTLCSGLIAGEYPQVDRILPKEFKTECLVNVEALRNALKSGSVINSKQNLVKLKVCTESIHVMNNSEEADYEAEVPCTTHGDELLIAFNQKYLMNTMGAIDSDNAIMCFNSSVAPCVVKEKDSDGIRLILPVRVAG